MQSERPFPPLYPYIIYLIATLGWIVAVFEALVAAPIITYLYLRHKGTKEPLKPVEE